MNKFKIGDEVSIIQGTRYFRGTFNNPKNKVGKIKQVISRDSLDINVLNYIVVWPGNFDNPYHATDLELVTSEMFPIF